jgi:hypothetical protein
LPGCREMMVSDVPRSNLAGIVGRITTSRSKVERAAIWIVKPDTEWTADTVSAVADALSALPPRSAPTRAVFVADAARAWTWCGSDLRHPLLTAENPRGRVGELSAGPWSRTALDLWLKARSDFALPPEEILTRMGGWDRAIRALINHRTAADVAKDLACPA